MEKLVLVPYEKYLRLLDGKTMEKKTPNPPKRGERDVLKKRVHPGNGINRTLRRATPLKTGSRSELREKKHLEILNIDSSRSVFVRYMRGPSPLYIEKKNDTAI